MDRNEITELCIAELIKLVVCENLEIKVQAIQQLRLMGAIESAKERPTKAAAKKAVKEKNEDTGPVPP